MNCVMCMETQRFHIMQLQGRSNNLKLNKDELKINSSWKGQSQSSPRKKTEKEDHQCVSTAQKLLKMYPNLRARENADCCTCEETRLHNVESRCVNI